jgi:hypothetical protein
VKGWYGGRRACGEMVRVVTVEEGRVKWQSYVDTPLPQLEDGWCFMTVEVPPDNRGIKGVEGMKGWKWTPDEIILPWGRARHGWWRLRWLLYLGCVWYAARLSLNKEAVNFFVRVTRWIPTVLNVEHLFLLWSYSVISGVSYCAFGWDPSIWSQTLNGGFSTRCDVMMHFRVSRHCWWSRV